MRRYRPAVLWNDINYPMASKPLGLYALFTEFFNQYCPQGLVNKRWGLSQRYTGDFVQGTFSLCHVSEPLASSQCRAARICVRTMHAS